MEFFFADLGVLIRTVLVGIGAYVGLLVLLRASGKRTLSQMNAFDFVVTVALGSTLATVIISNDTALIQGLVALALLIGLQFVITWSSQRSRVVARLAKSEPTVLAYRGRAIDAALRRERVLPDELAAALREHGLARVEEADLVVLETDGTIAVVERLASPSGSLKSTGLQVPRIDGEP